VPERADPAQDKSKAGDGRRYIIQSDELLSAFLELERVTIGQ
jgi:hypothetical protein